MLPTPIQHKSPELLVSLRVCETSADKVRNARTVPMYELTIKDMGGEFPRAGIKVWLDGKVINDYELSIFAAPGKTMTVDNLVDLAKRLVREFKADPANLDRYQDWQERYIP